MSLVPGWPQGERDAVSEVPAPPAPQGRALAVSDVPGRGSPRGARGPGRAITPGDVGDGVVFGGVGVGTGAGAGATGSFTMIVGGSGSGVAGARGALPACGGATSSFNANPDGEPAITTSVVPCVVVVRRSGVARRTAVSASLAPADETARAGATNESG